MAYNETKKFIFQQLGDRLKDKKQESGLTFYKIAGYKNRSYYEQKKPFVSDNDKLDVAKLISIVNGKAYSKRNPNLITYKYVRRLLEIFEFKNGLELLWGDYKKSTLSKNIFKKIIIDILNDDNKCSLKKEINRILVDYIPYAKYLSLWEMFFTDIYEMEMIPDNDYKLSSFFYGISEDDIIENYFSSQIEAIDFLYKKCSQEFNDLFYDFVKQDSNSLDGLNERLNSLADALQTILQDYISDENSLGLRVYNLMVSDWKKIGTLLVGISEKDKEDIYYYIDKFLIESSMKYVENLTRVQNLKRQFLL